MLKRKKTAMALTALALVGALALQPGDAFARGRMGDGRSIGHSHSAPSIGTPARNHAVAGFAGDMLLGTLLGGRNGEGGIPVILLLAAGADAWYWWQRRESRLEEEERREELRLRLRDIASRQAQSRPSDFGGTSGPRV